MKSYEINILLPEAYENWCKKQAQSIQSFLTSMGFEANSGDYIVLPSEPLSVLVVLSPDSIWSMGELPRSLPAGDYFVANYPLSLDITTLTLAWALGRYQFTRYCERSDFPTLATHKECNKLYLDALQTAIYWYRDVVNTPTEDMGVLAFEHAVSALAKQHKAQVNVISDAKTLRKDYPLIAAVGRAANESPRLLEVTWGNPEYPSVALVGKGVCYDTGGLSLKPSNSMLLMKKDMAGAAQAMALAACFMSLSLPIHLKVYLPIVENAIGPCAVRPGDVIRARNGKTVEINNTDAEGRLILADALTRAAEFKPDYLFDFATLTGGGALGPDLPALMTHDDALAGALLAAGERVQDELWRLPIYAGYRSELKSDVADLTNSAPKRYAGTIRAGIFLNEFVPEGQRWGHIDFVGYCHKACAASPLGAHAQGLRAVLQYVMERTDVA